METQTVKTAGQKRRAFATLQKFGADGEPIGAPIVSGIEGLKTFIAEGYSLNNMESGAEVTAELLNVPEASIEAMLAGGTLEKR